MTWPPGLSLPLQPCSSSSPPPTFLGPTQVQACFVHLECPLYQPFFHAYLSRPLRFSRENSLIFLQTLPQHLLILPCVVVPWHPKGLVPGVLVHTKIRGCSSPLCKMAKYSWPSVSAGSASTDLTNWNPRLVKSYTHSVTPETEQPMNTLVIIKCPRHCTGLQPLYGGQLQVTSLLPCYFHL